MVLGAWGFGFFRRSAPGGSGFSALGAWGFRFFGARRLGVRFFRRSGWAGPWDRGPWRAKDSHRRVRIFCDPAPKFRTLGYTAPLAHTKPRTLWRRTAKMSNPGVHRTRRYAKISNPLAPNPKNLEPSSARDPGSAKKSNPASENPARRATTHKLRKPQKN